MYERAGRSTCTESEQEREYVHTLLQEQRAWGCTLTWKCGERMHSAMREKSAGVTSCNVRGGE